MRKLRTVAPAALAAGMAILVGAASPAGAGDNDPGFKTSQPSMLTPLAQDSSVTPIMTVGETLGGGYKLESIPDGISLGTRGQGRLDVYLNHETSLVPFPLDVLTGVGQSDYTNAMLEPPDPEPAQRGRASGEIRDPEQRELPALLLELPRFGRGRERVRAARCSSRTTKRRPILSTAPVSAWPPRAKRSNRPAWSSHTTRSAMPSTGRSTGSGATTTRTPSPSPATATPVLLVGRRHVHGTFSSQLYMYTAASRVGGLERRRCSLGLQSRTTRSFNDYSDLSGAATCSLGGLHTRSAVAIAARWSDRGSRTGRTRTTCSSSSGSRTSRTTEANPNVVYFADTGEPRALPSLDPAARMTRCQVGTRGSFPNGRVFKMVLDPNDETHSSQPVDPDRGRPARRGERREHGIHPQSGQPGDDRRKHPDPGGPGEPEPVRGDERERDDRQDLALQPEQRCAHGCRKGQPGGRSCGPAGFLGVERNRRCVRGLRPRRLPRRRAGAHDPDGRDAGRHPDVQARGRTTHAPARARGLNPGFFQRAGAAKRPGPAVKTRVVRVGAPCRQRRSQLR